MKKIVMILTLAMLTVFSTAALAQNQDAPAASDRAWLEHRQSMAAIQDKMWAKSMEYEALVANPNSKHADITAVINEMSQLRGQMRNEREQFFTRMGDRGFGPGMGYGQGYGPGCGYGGGMGYGPGQGYGGGRHHRGGGFRHNW